MDLAENYENLKNNPNNEILDLKTKEIQELREENEILKLSSIRQKNNNIGKNNQKK